MAEYGEEKIRERLYQIAFSRPHTPPREDRTRPLITPTTINPWEFPIPTGANWDHQQDYKTLQKYGDIFDNVVNILDLKYKEKLLKKGINETHFKFGGDFKGPGRHPRAPTIEVHRQGDMTAAAAAVAAPTAAVAAEDPASAVASPHSAETRGMDDDDDDDDDAAAAAEEAAATRNIRRAEKDLKGKEAALEAARNTTFPIDITPYEKDVEEAKKILQELKQRATIRNGGEESLAAQKNWTKVKDELPRLLGAAKAFVEGPLPEGTEKYDENKDEKYKEDLKKKLQEAEQMSKLQEQKIEELEGRLRGAENLDEKLEISNKLDETKREQSKNNKFIKNAGMVVKEIGKGVEVAAKATATGVGYLGIAAFYLLTSPIWFVMAVN